MTEVFDLVADETVLNRDLLTAIVLKCLQSFFWVKA